METEELADELYTAYSAAVGGVNFKGEPLPNWTDFRNDPTKTKQSNAWIVVAQTALELFDSK